MSAAPLHPSRRDETRGLWLGLLGVTIFALTLPMTRLAVGSIDAPQLPGVFIAMGRAVVAALLSMAFLAITRAPLPRRGDWVPLALTAAGCVFGFPLFTSIALRHVEAMHASVIVGVLPLATALVGAWLHRQKPSFGFWICAAAGTALVAGAGPRLNRRLTKLTEKLDETSRMMIAVTTPITSAGTSVRMFINWAPCRR